MSQIEQREKGLEIGHKYKLHFLGRNGEEMVTIGADYIFEGVEDRVLKFSVLFDGRAKGSKRDPMIPNHLDLPLDLFNIGVFAESINEAVVKYNPRDAQDLIAGLPRRLWMFPG